MGENRLVNPLPNGPYDCILSDPPWTFATYSAKGKGRSPEQHYPCMSLAEIHALGADVQRIAAKDCALFLWVTMPLLPQGIEVMRSWGFVFKTCAFTWAKVAPLTAADSIPYVSTAGSCAEQHGYVTVKPQIGTGYWTRANAELCLLGTRGHPKRVDSGVPQLILAPRREHSRKPTETYGRIERLMGDEVDDGGTTMRHTRPIRRLEMFSRETRPGWDSWGLETGKFDAAT